MNQKLLFAVFLVFELNRKQGILFSTFYNFIFKKMALQNGFSYSLFSIKFKYETYFLKMKTKDYNTLKIFIF